MLQNGSVIVSRITRPTRNEGKRIRSGIGDTVRVVAGYVVDRARPHEFNPCLSALVHQDQSSLARGCNVVLGAIAKSVKVALRHEVFIAHHTRLDERSSPKQAADRPFLNRPKHLDSVNQLGGVHSAPCFLVAKYTLEISDSSANILDAFTSQFAGREVNSNGFANHESSALFPYWHNEFDVPAALS